MTTARASPEARGAGWLLPIAVLLAAMTDAVAGTALALGRFHVMGDIHATPDEVAWLDISYVALKLVGFAVTPWLMERRRPRGILLVSTLAMGGACGLAAGLARLDALVVLRGVQGFAGAALLVSGQAILFLEYPRSRQPLLQALFAVGAVVAPTTLAPALQGWLIDARSWTWIFWSVAPMALAAAGLLLICREATPTPARRSRSIDGWELALTCVAMPSFTYALSQGSRWDWFEAPHIVWLMLAGAGAVILIGARRAFGSSAALLDLSVLRSDAFAFALVVSVVAGAALLGSAYLIPALAAGALRFTPTEAGLVLLPSAGTFVLALFLTAAAVQLRNIPPIATVPFGLLLFMVAMILLSGANGDSGADTLAPAILLRGFALGLLFLSITLIALSALTPANVAHGIGLFNIGRQFGGLLGVAGLQTLIDHETALNRVVLGANVASATPAAGERLAATASGLTADGVDRGRAAAAAVRELAQSIGSQATLIGLGAAFMAVVLLFLIAGPLVVMFRIFLARRAKRRALAASVAP